MSQTHTGNVQPSIDNEEHDHLPGKVAVKKAGSYIWNGTDWERWDGTVSGGTSTATNFAFYGSTSDATYDYVAKQSADGKWYIMRIHKTTGIATYAVGDSAIPAQVDWATQDYDTWENHNV